MVTLKSALNPPESETCHQNGAYPGFHGIKGLRVFPVTGTHLHTWVERAIQILKCLAKEGNTDTEVPCLRAYLSNELARFKPGELLIV